MTRRPAVTQADVRHDAPMRLMDAARAFFPPDEVPSAVWLRRQASEGRLAMWRIAGKDFTTQEAIREMWRQCQCAQKGQGSGSPIGRDKSGDGQKSRLTPWRFCGHIRVIATEQANDH